MTEQKHREQNTCIIRLPSQGVADLRRDARRCGVRRRAAAAILKVVRAKQTPSRSYLGLSGRWVLEFQHAQSRGCNLVSAIWAAYQPPSSDHLLRSLHATNRMTAAGVVEPVSSVDKVSV
jgi:hypothetical protein